MFKFPILVQCVLACWHLLITIKNSTMLRLVRMQFGSTVCTTFHGNPFMCCQDISLRATNWLTNLHCHPWSHFGRVAKNLSACDRDHSRLKQSGLPGIRGVYHDSVMSRIWAFKCAKRSLISSISGLRLQMLRWHIFIWLHEARYCRWTLTTKMWYYL